MLRQGVRERTTHLHVVGHLAENRLELLVLRLRRENVQRTQQGKARTDHRGELPAHDRERLEVDALLEAAEADLHVEAAGLALDDVQRREAHALELAEGGGLTRCGELALDDLA